MSGTSALFAFWLLGGLDYSVPAQSVQDWDGAAIRLCSAALPPLPAQSLLQLLGCTKPQCNMKHMSNTARQRLNQQVGHVPTQPPAGSTAARGMPKHCLSAGRTTSSRWCCTAWTPAAPTMGHPRQGQSRPSLCCTCRDPSCLSVDAPNRASSACLALLNLLPSLQRRKRGMQWPVWSPMLRLSAVLSVWGLASFPLSILHSSSVWFEPFMTSFHAVLAHASVQFPCLYELATAILKLAQSCLYPVNSPVRWQPRHLIYSHLLQLACGIGCDL